MQGVCDHFRVEQPEDFGLQYIDLPNHYISVSNKDERLKVSTSIRLINSLLAGKRNLSQFSIFDVVRPLNDFQI